MYLHLTSCNDKCICTIKRNNQHCTKGTRRRSIKPVTACFRKIYKLSVSYWITHLSICAPTKEQVIHKSVSRNSNILVLGLLLCQYISLRPVGRVGTIMYIVQHLLQIAISHFIWPFDFTWWRNHPKQTIGRRPWRATAMTHASSDNWVSRYKPGLDKINPYSTPCNLSNIQNALSNLILCTTLPTVQKWKLCPYI